MADQLLIKSRRNFLVRALGFMAVPAAAPWLAAPAMAALPTISPELIANIHRLQVANAAQTSAWESLNRPGVRHFKDYPGGELTPEYAAFHEHRARYKVELEALLNTILGNN